MFAAQGRIGVLTVSAFVSAGSLAEVRIIHLHPKAA